jgi:hypothetical protein
MKLTHARAVLETWRCEYNQERLKESSAGWHPPSMRGVWPASVSPHTFVFSRSTLPPPAVTAENESRCPFSFREADAPAR